ncbi:ribosome maturation factor RimM [Pseudorhodobacter sp.]|uniref:ribosome maturation factor RimM n=1 Tax=Pseudorhodobacter sp. TaxID=1934400 RepID=UPI002647AE47|nr:ribosome maturation factor RimM [Pseudorhodobacter sp.]MDN5786034.1 ribosome maturation factor RimM [Pseudorhodobacter sp.]
MVKPDPEKWLCVGAISGAYGVKGEVRLKSFCAEPTAIADYGPLFSEDGLRSFKITLTRPVSGGLGARLSGVATKEEADALRGQSLYVGRDKLPSLPDDEFYHTDLIGLEARDTGGAVLGKVIAVHNHGAGDLLEIGTAAGSILLAFSLATVPTVDLAAGRIVVDLPEGLD